MAMRIRSISFAALALALAACGGSSSSSPSSPASATASKTAAAAGDAQARCQAFFARARECSQAYIDNLVDLRIEVDNPPGIAAEAQGGGRDALVAKALEEWATDSQPENTARTCADAIARMPPEHVEGMLAQSEQCMAPADCDAFGACSKELQRPMITPH